MSTLQSDRSSLGGTGSDWTPGAFRLRDTWFPAAHVAQLSEAPIRRLIHSQPYYLWRDSAGFHARASHPSTPKPPPRASALSFDSGEYPMAVAYGFLWVWYGTAAHASPDLIPHIPFIPRDRQVAAHLRGSYYFGCCKELMGENVLDLTHINFIHRAAAGFDEAESDNVEVESTSETVTMTRRTKRQQTPEFQRNYAGVTSKYQDVTAVIHLFLRSGLCFFTTRFEPGTSSMPLLQALVPESRRRTLMHFAYSPSDETPSRFSQEWPKHAPIVVQQDDMMLYEQNPRYAKSSVRPDMHTRFDKADVEFRARTLDLIERQRRGDYSYLPDGDPQTDLRHKLCLQGTYSASDGATVHA